MILYDLTFIREAIINDNNLQDDKYYSINKTNNSKYKIVSYNKDFLRQDLIYKYGLLKSVIVSKSNVLCFAPPKSLSAETFMLKYPINTNKIVAEEFVEGIMINLFFDPDLNSWEVATRNIIGTSIYKQMFLDVCSTSNLIIDSLNKNYCYSFVLQHTTHRLVNPLKYNKLYLINVYEIIQTNKHIIINEIDNDEIRHNGLWFLTGIKFVERYEFSSYSDLIEKFASRNTPYNIMGVIIRNKITGQRSKFRNPNYEEIKYLKNNQCKLQYQYLCLRREGKVAEVLKYCPEMKQIISQFRDHLHMFTNNLHKNYVECYVKKKHPLFSYPLQMRPHMKNLHQHYIDNLLSQKLGITNTEVIKYVNNLHPSILIYALNYNLRKKMIDDIKCDSWLN